jgi:hypothetical protein
MPTMPTMQEIREAREAQRLKDENITRQVALWTAGVIMTAYVSVGGFLLYLAWKLVNHFTQ